MLTFIEVQILFYYNLKMVRGLLVIISGPSGVGKGTVRQFLMQDKSLNLHYSISCTTRKPRNGEVEGKDYFFLTKDQFIKDIGNNMFLEYAEFCGNYYGTPKTFVDKLRDEGKNVILEIDTTGARKLIPSMNHQNEIAIFIEPPNFKELENRIRGRKTEAEAVILERLEKAKFELTLAKEYDYQVVNDIPENCANQIIKIIKERIK